MRHEMQVPPRCCSCSPGPQTTAYNELGQACSAAGVSVELFVANNSYVDAATIGQLPRLTGGQLHKYTYFQVCATICIKWCERKSWNHEVCIM